jgi:hypothetical protein
MKPLNVYSKIAQRAWTAFQKEDDERIDFSSLLKFLDYSEIFLVDAQVRVSVRVRYIDMTATIKMTAITNLNTNPNPIRPEGSTMQ